MGGALSLNHDFKRRAAHIPSALSADEGERRPTILKGTCTAGRLLLSAWAFF